MSTLTSSVLPEVAELGRPLGEYRRSWIAPLIGWGGVFLMMLAGLWTTLRSPTMPWWSVIIFGTLAALTLGVTVFDTLAARKGRMILYEHGLLDMQRRKARIYCWNMVLALRLDDRRVNGINNVDMRARFKNLPDLRLGMAFVFKPGQLKTTEGLRRLNVLELIDAISCAVHPHLKRSAVAAYDAGETIDLGAIKLSQAGIQTRFRQLPWLEVAEIIQEGNYIVVSRQGKKLRWAAVYIPHIHNLALFYAVLTHHQHTQH